MCRTVTVVVCVCVCVCVGGGGGGGVSHISGASVHSENTVTYSASNGGQNICRVFSENASLETYSVICHAVASYRTYAQFFNDRALSSKADGRLNAAWNTDQCKAVSYNI